MPLVLEANYSKKLGLPGYSSHQYSVTVRTELSDIAQVQAESTRLYAMLQSCVDRELKTTGFLPVLNANGAQVNGNGHANSNGHKAPNGWTCSPRQRELIEKIITEQRLSSDEVEHLASTMFGVPLLKLNKLQASGLIDELTGRNKPATMDHRTAQRAQTGTYARGRS